MNKRFLYLFILVSLFFLNSLPQLYRDAEAQTKEFTSADRLALLYTKLLKFNAEGEPLVRIRALDNVDEVRLYAQAPLVVQPQGPGFAEIKLPAKRHYTVRIVKGKAGSYQHAVILARYAPGQFEQAEKDMQKWRDAGLETQSLDIGSLFALRGKMFDNRERLIIGPYDANEQIVISQKESLQKNFNLDLDIHSELETYPSGTLILQDETREIEISHKDILYISSSKPLSLVNSRDGKQTKNLNLQYDGQLIFTPDKHAKLAVSNAAGLESILRGIVPLEIYPSAPKAALTAQAIAARGTIIAQIGRRHLADPYHVCNLQHCQVHGGSGAAKKSCDEAIKDSRGQILFHGNTIAQTYYSSHCGGHSSTSLETWLLEDLPYLKALSDTNDREHLGFNETLFKEWWDTTPNDYCSPTENLPSFASMRNARWEASVSAKQIQEKLKELRISLGDIKDIEILERGKSYRATKIRILGTKGQHTIERELPIRRFFQGLKSALFFTEVKKNSKGFVSSISFYGAGFGHGVGMCQSGAVGMGQRGLSAAEILKHYYPGTEILSLW